jgi:chromate transporter
MWSVSIGSVFILALAVVYAGLGVTPIARGALYGVGPVVLGLFAVAVYRLGRTAASTVPEAIIGLVAAAADSLANKSGVYSSLRAGGFISDASEILEVPL